MKNQSSSIHFCFSSLRIYLLLWFLCCFGLTSNAQFYNGSQLTFGKNRVQYNQRLWTFLRFDEFDTYYYRGGKELAVFTSRYANDEVRLIEKQLDYNLNHRIQFVIFNKLSDLKQSNVGLISDAQYNVGGVTHIVGTKLFLYFEGDYSKLKSQIRAGITRIIFDHMMYGESITSQMKNSTLMALPGWYVNGFLSYITEDWNTDIDNRVRDGILSNRYEKFSLLEGDEATYAGHSIWKFIGDRYGKEVISNILYMTKVTRNIESGFLYVLGRSYKSLINEWMEYYKFEYKNNYLERVDVSEIHLLKRAKKFRVYKELKLCPDTSLAAFVTNDVSKYKVWIYDTICNKKKRIIHSGHKSDEKTDYSYPILAWHPTAKLLSIITEEKGKIWLYTYYSDSKKKEKQQLFYFEKVLDFSYSHDGLLLVLSAVQNGRQDIFVHNRSSHTNEQITDDIYNDYHAKFINNSSEIIFASNRQSDTLVSKRINSSTSFPLISSNNDIFIYDYSSRNKILRRLTNTLNVNESYPNAYIDNYYTYLSDKNGINNRFIAYFDSTVSFIDTSVHYNYYTKEFAVSNYSSGIFEYEIISKTNKFSEVIFFDGLYRMYTYNIQNPEIIKRFQLQNTPYITKKNRILRKRNLKNVEGLFVRGIPDERIYEDKDIAKSKKIDIDNYEFGSDGVKEKLMSSKDTSAVVKDGGQKKSIDELDDFRIPRERMADVEYSINQLVSQVDFNSLNTSYQHFSGGNSPIYINPGMKALIKVGAIDLFEDHRITGGVWINPASFNENEYFMSYNDLTRRLDREIVFHRQSIKNFSQYSFTGTHYNELFYVLKWPFSRVSCIKTTFSIRNERISYLSTDEHNLKKPSIYKNWGGIKGEYVFDNTRSRGLNLYYGLRYKIFGEYFRLYHKDNINMGVLGVDLRHYQKIHKTFIWANRFASGTSMGNNKLIHYMGGVDTWLFPKFNKDINVANDMNYTYQTLATNMRGFTQNIRNGNSFAAINSELRFPIFKYFAKRPLKSDFFNHFQIIAFGDIGTAWTGIDPYSEDNSLYTRLIPDPKDPENRNNTIWVKLFMQTEPIVGGYGGGLRSRLLGYFVRADLAWGVEDGVINTPVFYLSLSLDF